MDIYTEIEKLEGVLDDLLLKKNKSLEDEDRIKDLNLTISELMKEAYFKDDDDRQTP